MPLGQELARQTPSKKPLAAKNSYSDRALNLNNCFFGLQRTPRWPQNSPGDRPNGQKEEPAGALATPVHSKRFRQFAKREDFDDKSSKTMPGAAFEPVFISQGPRSQFPQNASNRGASTTLRVSCVLTLSSDDLPFAASCWPLKPLPFHIPFRISLPPYCCSGYVIPHPWL